MNPPARRTLSSEIFAIQFAPTDDDDDDAIEECDDVRYDHDKAPKGTTSMRRPLELLHEPCRVRSMIVYMVNYAR